MQVENIRNENGLLVVDLPETRTVAFLDVEGRVNNISLKVFYGGDCETDIDESTVDIEVTGMDVDNTDALDINNETWEDVSRSDEETLASELMQNEEALKIAKEILLQSAKDW